MEVRVNLCVGAREGVWPCKANVEVASVELYVIMTFAALLPGMSI